MASLIQYGADAEDESRELSEREEAAREKLIYPVKSVNAIQNESLVDSRNMEKPCSLLILKSEYRLVSAYYENYFTDISDEDKIYEGLKKQYNGCYCHVCGLDFQEVYGELGKDFIHVNHIKPLSEIDSTYVVDYKNDLVPICPNCHAMLHKKVFAKDYMSNIYNLKRDYCFT